MGYSCAKDAANMLGVICHLYQTDGNPNLLTVKGKKFFFERGREQYDGAITGRLMLCISDTVCRSYGNVRIEADGKITFFPAIGIHGRNEAWKLYQEVKQSDPDKLRVWATGRI